MTGKQLRSMLVQVSDVLANASSVLSHLQRCHPNVSVTKETMKATAFTFSLQDVNRMAKGQF